MSLRTATGERDALPLASRALLSPSRCCVFAASTTLQDCLGVYRNQRANKLPLCFSKAQSQHDNSSRGSRTSNINRRWCSAQEVGAALVRPCRILCVGTNHVLDMHDPILGLWQQQQESLFRALPHTQPGGECALLSLCSLTLIVTM